MFLKDFSEYTSAIFTDLGCRTLNNSKRKKKKERKKFEEDLHRAEFLAVSQFRVCTCQAQTKREDSDAEWQK